ncbi:MAG: ribosomal protein bL12 [Candidatus Hodgkinia cicadicola]
MSQVTEIVKLIGELKLVQLIDLIGELEQTFKVNALHSDQAVRSSVSTDGKVSVSLITIGPNKINVIKEIRSILELGLKESKEFVENIPRVIKSDLTPIEANELKRRLEKTGASVLLK